jgi:hypothetical protein
MNDAGGASGNGASGGAAGSNAQGSNGNTSAGNGGFSPEQQNQLHNMINGALSNRLSRGAIKKMFDDGIKEAVTGALSGEALSGAVEKVILQMAGTDGEAGAGAQGQATQDDGVVVTPSNPGANVKPDERYLSLEQKYKNLEKQLKERDQQAQAEKQRAETIESRGAVRSKLVSMLGADSPHIDPLMSHLFDVQKRFGRGEDGSVVMKFSRRMDDGTTYEDVRALDDGIKEWAGAEGKAYIPAKATHLPPAGLPFGSRTSFTNPGAMTGQGYVAQRLQIPEQVNGRPNPFLEVAAAMAGIPGGNQGGSGGQK